MSFSIYTTDNPDVIYFEHNIEGDNYAGSMWFEGKILTDYDGVFELPKEVIQMMIDKGCDMTYAFNNEDFKHE
jgi:hypothetical protein